MGKVGGAVPMRRFWRETTDNQCGKRTVARRRSAIFLIHASVLREVGPFNRRRSDMLMPAEARSLRELTPQQWKSGVGAWLGWFFDGLELHLYTLVAARFVAQLLHAAGTTQPEV